MEYTQAELDTLLEAERCKATIRCRMLRPLAGGQPAGRKGVEAFVHYQCKIDPESEEGQAAVNRILKDEIGERETTPDGGEVNEAESYGINVIRRTELGPYIGHHQLKAMLKQAASRLGLFKKKIGSKGDLVELGTVSAVGRSLADPARPWEVYLYKVDSGGPDDNEECFAPADTHFDRLQGKVSTPAGMKSIQHDTEVAEESTQFHFELRWPTKKLKEEDMALVIAAATQIGIGSCLSLGYGRFEVMLMTVGEPPVVVVG